MLFPRSALLRQLSAPPFHSACTWGRDRWDISQGSCWIWIQAPAESGSRFLLNPDPGSCWIRIQTEIFWQNFNKSLQWKIYNRNFVVVDKIGLLKHLQRKFRLQEKPSAQQNALQTWNFKFFSFFVRPDWIQPESNPDPDPKHWYVARSLGLRTLFYHKNEPTLSKNLPIYGFMLVFRGGFPAIIRRKRTPQKVWEIKSFVNGCSVRGLEASTKAWKFFRR